MLNWIINFLRRLILGRTDLNNNGIPDNKDILKLIQDKLEKKKQIKNKKFLKKILK